MISFCNRRIRLSETYEKACVHKTAVSSQSQKPRGKERKKERKGEKTPKGEREPVSVLLPKPFLPDFSRLSCTCLRTTQKANRPLAHSSRAHQFPLPPRATIPPSTNIHTKNTAPMIQKANAACHCWQMLRCCSHARVLRSRRFCGLLKT
jgi:hypothetical protein